MNAKVTLNAIEVKRVGTTIFIPLPPELWQPIDHCICGRGRCGPGNAFWDTLAVSMRQEPKPRDLTWVVHYPELHTRAVPVVKEV